MDFALSALDFLHLVLSLLAQQLAFVELSTLLSGRSCLEPMLSTVDSTTMGFLLLVRTFVCPGSAVFALDHLRPEPLLLLHGYTHTLAWCFLP